jgi:hypothetical protein
MGAANWMNNSRGWRALQTRKLLGHANAWDPAIRRDLQLFAKLMTLSKNRIRRTLLMHRVSALISRSILVGFLLRVGGIRKRISEAFIAYPNHPVNNVI